MRLKPPFLLQKKILKQICFKNRYSPSGELFDELIVLNVYGSYTVERLDLFSQISSLCSTN